jgi:transposase InsO family protein
MSEQTAPAATETAVPTKHERITDKDPAVKLARKRLSVLELAAELGSITKACKQAGMDRTSFYEYKRRFQTHGLEGLKDLPPVHKSHPQTTSEEHQKRIVELALQQPTRGCNYLAALLAQEGIGVSFVTVQNILNKQGLGSRYERLLALEQKALKSEITLTAEQIKLIEQTNPCFAERHVESSRPGELLSQDTFYVGTLKGVGKVYLHTVVDTFGSYAFGVLGTSKQPEWAVSVLYNDVLPFYQEKAIPVSAILTDNGREFCGREIQHPFELLLAMSDIEHRRTKVATPRTNGFVERFHRTVLDEFFRVTFRTTFYESVEALQTALDEWLRFYNEERPHQGYRNMGKRPLDTICAYLKQRDVPAGSPEAGEPILATAQAIVRQEG